MGYSVCSWSYRFTLWLGFDPNTFQVGGVISYMQPPVALLSLPVYRPGELDGCACGRVLLAVWRPRRGSQHLLKPRLPAGADQDGWAACSKTFWCTSCYHLLLLFILLHPPSPVASLQTLPSPAPPTLDRTWNKLKKIQFLLRQDDKTNISHPHIANFVSLFDIHHNTSHFCHHMISSITFEAASALGAGSGSRQHLLLVDNRNCRQTIQTFMSLSRIREKDSNGTRKSRQICR